MLEVSGSNAVWPKQILLHVKGAARLPNCSRVIEFGAVKFPAFPETFLSGISALWLEGSRLGLMLPGAPGRLVFVGREPAEALLDGRGVVPMG
jgi:hypothetical protein